jgi:hypothetical protein
MGQVYPECQVAEHHPVKKQKHRHVLSWDSLPGPSPVAASSLDRPNEPFFLPLLGWSRHAHTHGACPTSQRLASPSRGGRETITASDQSRQTSRAPQVSCSPPHPRFHSGMNQSLSILATRRPEKSLASPSAPGRTWARALVSRRWGTYNRWAAHLVSDLATVIINPVSERDPSSHLPVRTPPPYALL